MNKFAIWVACSFASLVYAQLSLTTTPFFNITTIATANGASIFQCWQLATPFANTNTPGQTAALDVFLSNTSSVSFTVIPPRFDEGYQNAPGNQFVFYTTGLVHVVLPNTTAGPTTELWMEGGKYGYMLVTDTKNVSRYGHRSIFVSDADTIAVRLPITGPIPKHKVLYEGPCKYDEYVGL